MAKYNLLEDDDIFDEDDDLTDQKEKSEPESALDETLDIEIDEQFLNIDPEEKSEEAGNDFGSQLDIDASANFESETIDPEPEQDLEEIEPVADIPTETKHESSLEEKPYLTDDFEDEKQAGINYKPIVIGAVILLFFALIYFAIDTWVLTDSENEPQAIETPSQKTPEQIRQEQEAARKAEFLGTLTAKTNSDAEAINQIIQTTKGKAKLSSVLLYDKTFMFEVFGSTRNDIASFNMNLKQKMAQQAYEIISSSTRPGANGGVFTLFKGEIGASNATSGTASQPTLNTVKDAENKLSQSANANGLKVVSVQNRPVGDESNFKKYEIETTLNGSLDACQKFISGLAEGTQAKIHKLNLTAVDQKSFQTARYQLKLILEIFV